MSSFTGSFFIGDETMMKLEAMPNDDSEVIEASPDAKLISTVSRNKTKPNLLNDIEKDSMEFVSSLPENNQRRSDSSVDLEKPNYLLENLTQFFNSEINYHTLSTNESTCVNVEKLEEKLIIEDDVNLTKPDLLNVTFSMNELNKEWYLTNMNAKQIDNKANCPVTDDIGIKLNAQISSQDLQAIMFTESFGETEIAASIIIDSKDTDILDEISMNIDSSSYLPLDHSIDDFTSIHDKKNMNPLLEEYHETKESKGFIRSSNSHPNANNIKNEFQENICVRYSNLNSGVIDINNLKHLNLPETLLMSYNNKGIKNLFEWQIECLSNKNVIEHNSNLVFSAPTSAGKTLISEILMVKNCLERNKKCIFILPFISIVREKMIGFQELFNSTGLRVDGFYGGYSPTGGITQIDVAIMTIEKANSIINRLLSNGELDTLGLIVIDEIHLISDPNRGYILELLLAKVMFAGKKLNLKIQLITMSATIPNLSLLKHWLNAELYITNFRPIELHEQIKIGNIIYDNEMTVIRKLETKNMVLGNKIRDPDNIAELCIETMQDGFSCIVFCPSKDWCESLCIDVTSAIRELCKTNEFLNEKFCTVLNHEKLAEIKHQLMQCPVHLDKNLEIGLKFGCAFHHAGLTTDERDIIENGFKNGIIKIIVATSTLSSGVNLPARRVIVRTPIFAGKPISSMVYQQMIGRAGRMGIDTSGESILICTESTASIGRKLIKTELTPVTSCLHLDNYINLKRALLEIIASGMACTMSDIADFMKHLLMCQENEEFNYEELILEINNLSLNGKCTIVSTLYSSLQFLREYEFIRMNIDPLSNSYNFQPTKLGLACLNSSMPPADGFLLFCELQKSRQCFVLESELHAIYIVTPYSVSFQLGTIDWLAYLEMWEKLPNASKRVGELVGVKESHIVKLIRGLGTIEKKSLQILKRFYTALALEELVNEVPITTVALKYKCSKGLLQSLQHLSSTFAGIVTCFANTLGWTMISVLIEQFKDRLYFGIQNDLIELLKLPNMNQKRARTLYNGNIKSLLELANANSCVVEKLFYNSICFESERQHDNENQYDADRRKSFRNIFVTGKKGITIEEGAKLLIMEARQYLENELNINIQWANIENSKEMDVQSTINNDLITNSQNIETIEINLCESMEMISELKTIIYSENTIGLAIVQKRIPIVNTKLHKNMNYNFIVKQFHYISHIEFFVNNKLFILDLQSNNIDLNNLKIFLEDIFYPTKRTYICFNTLNILKLLSHIILIDNIHSNLLDGIIGYWLLNPNDVKPNELLNKIRKSHQSDSYESVMAIKFLESIKPDIMNVPGLWKIFTEIEIPMQFVLAKMELNGLPVNTCKLNKLIIDLNELLKCIEEKLYTINGKKFNIASSKEVAKVVGITNSNRCSTAKSVLMRINNPICQLIIKYRKVEIILKNLQSLKPTIKNERVYSKNIYTTSTGRMNLHEPNLQNIAKSFEIKLEEQELKIISCRNVFEVSQSNRSIISADFCQLELRILTHYSKDSTLIQIMQSDTDIFKEIASKWNQISLNDVTEDLRQNAKQICYGIIYGMGNRSLSANLRCTENEASLLIEQFYSTYPNIKVYTDRVLEKARLDGYVETINGRRRYLPQLNSDIKRLKSAMERKALNSIIQGSAADIAKMAILRFNRNLKKYAEQLQLKTNSIEDSVNLILHLHDELIYEVPQRKAKQILKILKYSMENSVKLLVPLKTKIKMGHSWGTQEEIVIK